VIERLCIRVLIAAALCLAVAAFLFVPLPMNSRGNLALPAVALQQAGLYRLEVALLVFYGGLLLVTPAFSGLVRGRLPAEISTRGARFADEAGFSLVRNEAAIKKLERTTSNLKEEAAETRIDIERLERLLPVTSHSER